jgi:putative oxidoreductase
MKEKLQNFGLLWLRAAMGVGFMFHGWNKIVVTGVDVFAEKGVAPMGFPLPLLFAWLAVLSEFVGGFLNVLGLWTRVAAFFTACVVGTAFFVRHVDDPFSKRELALAYLVVSVTIIFVGPGRYSFDGRGKSKSSSTRSKKR